MQKVTLKYHRGIKKDEVITLEVPEQELEQMLEYDYQLRSATAADGEVVERQTAQEFFDELNREELSSWRKHNRRLIPVKAEDEESSEMDIMDLVVDNSQEKERQRQEDYEMQCQFIRSVLKTEQAEMMIAIALDGMTLMEYATEMEDEYNNVFRRYKRTLEILRKKLH